MRKRGEFEDQTISSETSSSGESENESEDYENIGQHRNGQEYSSSSDVSDSSDQNKKGSKYTRKEDDRNDSSLQSSNAQDSETGNNKEEVKSIYSHVVNMTKSEGRHAEELKNKAEQESSQY